MVISTNLGRVSLTPRGEYDPAAQYTYLDLVRYEGSGYIVLRPVQGVTPVDGGDYMLLAQAGAPGAPGEPGADGTGDMTKSVYDQHGKNTDIFDYVDDALQDIPAAENAVTIEGGGTMVPPAGLGPGPYTMILDDEDGGGDDPGGESPPVPAADVTYDNASSGLEAETVQAAIDELSSVKADAWRVSNRNLLDNWYFPRPINQRGQTVYTNAGSGSTLYTIDRWCTYNKAVLTVSEGEISLVFPGDQAEGTYIIGQRMEDFKQLRGKTMTLSLLTSSLSGKINLAVQFQPDYAGNIASSTTEEAGLLSVTFTVPTDAAILGLIINAYNKTSSTLVPVAMKLELGPVQTLAHQDEYGAWVLNDPPPDYATELVKCQSLLLIIPNSGADFVGIGQGIAYSATNVVIDVPIPVSMRSRPIMTMTGNYVIRGNGSAFLFNATERVCQIGNYGTNLITIDMGGFSNLPINHTISLTNNNDPSAKIIFSCES